MTTRRSPAAVVHTVADGVGAARAARRHQRRRRRRRARRRSSLATQRADGGWDEDEFTGTGFPRHFYLRYWMYRDYFPLMELGQRVTELMKQKQYAPMTIAQMAPSLYAANQGFLDSVPVEKIHVGLGAHAMAVVPPWEDAVTLGANAAARVFRQGEVRPDEIGLLVAATETAVDHAKPIGIFLHDLLGLPPICRTFEVKHACYGGTAGIMLAADWIRSGAARGRKALVVATDIARYDVGSSAEFTQGAGAAAVVVSEEPRLLRMGPTTGLYARNVYDFWRPLDRREALVDGKFSLDCYLDALRGAVADYRSALNGHGGGSLLERFAAFLYHTPFLPRWRTRHRGGGGRIAGLTPAAVGERFERSWSTQAEPAIGLARQAGNTYTASLYLCLAWLLEREGATLEGRELALSPTARVAARSSSPRDRCPGSASRARASGRRHSSRRAAC
jgi:3-hydroxy-3-methylglutaryl CoA synthase